MSRTHRGAALGAAALVLAVACSKVPYTGRTQFNAIPDSTMHELGREAYAQILAESRVIKGTDDARTLRRVGNDIAAVADEPDFAWEVALIDDPAVNAWCLPGGYIGFYTGILPVLDNEAGMAFVMGHEVGHAVAEHASERMSQQLGVSGALTLIDTMLTGGAGLSARQAELIYGALGVGAQLGILLPFSRTHEKEADVLGLMLMAQAGYPPKEATRVWNRMERRAGQQPPEWLSTHPSYDARREVIAEWLPQAQKRYARNRRSEDVTASIW